VRGIERARERESEREKEREREREREKIIGKGRRLERRRNRISFYRVSIEPEAVSQDANTLCTHHLEQHTT